MRAPNDLGSRQQWRLRNSLLWILAASLGATTVYSVGVTIHDTGQQRTAAQVVIRSTAHQVASLARTRLELTTIETFAPVASWIASRPLTGPAAVEALARAQREGERCRCRQVLPVSEFFRVDPTTGSLDRAPISANAGAAVPPSAVLVDLAREDARRARGGRAPSIHLATPTRLGDQLALTFVQHDASGEAEVVYGLLARARETVRGLFIQDPAHQQRVDPDTVHALVRFDSLSVRVSTEDGTVLFGMLGPGRPYTASVRPTGPMEGLVLDIALRPEQIVFAFILIPHQSLWHLGVLFLCTLLVIVLAASSSRREVLLARARSDFIAGVSHDLRMPLAQILLAGETLTLRRERNETERASLASSIVRETQRLIALVENVLLFSRSGAVELQARLQPLPVDELFSDVVEAVHLAVEDAGQTIDVQSAPSVGVHADRQLIRQALVNLVDNALKYGSPGQRIALSAAQPSGATVHLRVDDEGPGVPRAERARVFEPYERLDHDQTSERTGTGLGLAVVREIMRACGGRVWLEDAPSRGTRVVLELRSAGVPEPIAQTNEV